MNWSRTLQAASAIVLLSVVTAFVVQAYPSLVGMDYSFVVQSGSMEPAITTGSVVFVESSLEPADIEEGDIITFSESQRGPTTTHRVVEVHRAETSARFVTKGDANENADPEAVHRGEIVGRVPQANVPVLGRVAFSVPLMGYVVSFSNTGLGWATMVLVPTVSLILSELWSLWSAANRTENTGETT